MYKLKTKFGVQNFGSQPLQEREIHQQNREKRERERERERETHTHTHTENKGFLK
jgi:hypothetical protein